MVLIVKCFAIILIAATAFATPRRNNNFVDRILQRVPDNANLINQDNSVTVIRADETCTGSIVGNRNSVYNCGNSFVEILNNRNSQISAASSTLTVKSNTNAVINGANNRIVAVDNTNLVVGGDNNQLDISNTRNHAVVPSRSSSNSLAFSKTTSTISYTNSYTNVNVHSPCVFNVEYVQSAKINGSSYQLGNYNFDVAEGSDTARVTLQGGSVTDSTSNRIVIQGQGNDSLELIGQRVEILGANSFNIYCY
jgi:hypothetical protein